MNIKKLLNYIGFSFQVLKNKIGKRNLFSLSLDITDKCNSSCSICGIWKKNPPVIMDPVDFERVIKSSKILRKVKLFSIGGGEPFTDPERLSQFLSIIHKYSNPLQVRIVSNGLLTDNIVDFFSRWSQIDKLSLGLKISFDGLGQNYEKIRGVKNGDKKVIETIDRLLNQQKLNKNLEKYLDISIGFTLMDQNLSDLDAIFRISQDRHIGFFYKPVLLGGRYLNHGMGVEYSLDVNQHKTFLLNFNKKLMEYIGNERNFKERLTYNLFYQYFNKLLIGHQAEMGDLKCGALKNSLYIIPNGDIYPCLMSEEKIGNIFQENFDDLWKNLKYKEFKDKIQQRECWCLTPCDTIPSLIETHFPFFF